MAFRSAFLIKINTRTIYPPWFARWNGHGKAARKGTYLERARRSVRRQGGPPGDPETRSGCRRLRWTIL